MSQVGPYELGRELGRGGMGVVHEARHPGLPGRRLAIKQLAPGLADAETWARFLREAQLLARVRHAGVVRVHDAAMGPGGPYLVTELIEGEPLDAVVQRGGLPPARAAEVVAGLADAAAALHAAGVLHRDLKPGNVLLRPDGRAVLLDFGLARELDGASLTRSGDLLGTPAYMAPEQVRDPRRVDARADVYGLGAILYALLRGQPPFQGPLVRVLGDLLERGPAWPACADPALDAICRRAVAREPETRPESAAELRDALRLWIAGARGPAIPRRIWKLLGGLALVSGVGLVLWRRGEPTPLSPTPIRPPEARPASPAASSRGAPALRKTWSSHRHRDEAQACFLPGEEGLAASLGLDDQALQLWRIDPLREELIPCGAAEPLPARPLGLLVDRGGRMVVLLEHEGLRYTVTHEGPHGSPSLRRGTSQAWPSGTARLAALSPDGTKLLVGGHFTDKPDQWAVAVCDTDADARTWVQTVEQRPTALAVGPDGTWFLDGMRPHTGGPTDPGTLERRGRDGAVVWKTTLESPPEALLVSASGERVLVGTQSGALLILATETGDELQRFRGSPSEDSYLVPAEAHASSVGVLAWGPGQHVVYSASGQRPRLPSALDLRTWSAEEARELRPPLRMEEAISSLALSADGRWALAGSHRGSLLLWAVTPP